MGAQTSDKLTLLRHDSASLAGRSDGAGGVERAFVNTFRLRLRAGKILGVNLARATVMDQARTLLRSSSARARSASALPSSAVKA